MSSNLSTFLCFTIITLLLKHYRLYAPFVNPGGTHTDMTWYTYMCACLLGHFITDIDIVIGSHQEFLSQMKVSNLYKLGVFWAIDGKKNHKI